MTDTIARSDVEASTAEGLQSVSVMLPAAAAIRCLRAVLPIVGNKDLRYRPGLRGALLTVADGKAKVVGTDSYRLAILEFDVPDAVDRDLFVPTDMLASLAKAVTRTAAAKVNYLQIACEWQPHKSAVGHAQTVKSLTLSHPGGTVQLPEGFERAQYPSYEQLLPTGDNDGCPMVAFNPRYLAEIASIASELGLDNTTPVRQRVWDAKKPALFEIVGPDVQVTYLLMPVRVAV